MLLIWFVKNQPNVWKCHLLNLMNSFIDFINIVID